ncbi:S8 family serine peptidase [Streptomyces sp. NPDC008125]|uniref:S8 family peptidase n=1 Tax=Streptomyces sp. NPDC008125 TaxID=3364811 RepID=UPI0036E0AEFC
MHTRHALVLASAFALALAGPLATSAASAPTPPNPEPAPLIRAGDPIPGRYIVTLDPLVDAARTVKSLGLAPTFTYSKALNGFAVPLTPAQLTTLRDTPGVTSVEEDAKNSVPVSEAVPAYSPVPASRAANTQGAAAGLVPASTWGLDRIDQRNLPLDGDFTTGGNGAGVTAYILDSGIDYEHSEFGGAGGSRASFGFDAVSDGRRGADCHGHGTHVAGTVAGSTYGVAREANLVSVRVLGCDGSGSNSGLIAALDWVARNAVQPAVLNGSLGGGMSQTVNRATTALAASGVLPVLAAGNDAKDACDVSPASADGALTVAASNRSDVQASFSNWGDCVELYAPGQDIVSARLGGGSVSLNGTSMAAPHVTGLAVLYKQAHPDAAPAEVATWIDEVSTRNVLTGVSPGTPNHLLFTDGL